MIPKQNIKIIVTFLIGLRYIDSVRTFRAFYNEHKDRFFAYLMRSTGDYYLAGDIMQESFTRYLDRYGNRPAQYLPKSMPRVAGSTGLDAEILFF